MGALLALLLGKLVFDIVKLGIRIVDEALQGLGIRLARLLVGAIELFDGGFNLGLLGVRAVDDVARLDFSIVVDALRFGAGSIEHFLGGTLGGHERIGNGGSVSFLFGKLLLELGDASVFFIGRKHRSRIGGFLFDRLGLGFGHRGLGESGVHVHRLVIIETHLVIIELVNASEKLFDLGIQAVNLGCDMLEEHIDLVNVVTLAINRETLVVDVFGSDGHAYSNLIRYIPRKPRAACDMNRTACRTPCAPMNIFAPLRLKNADNQAHQEL